jgi:dephospho-CoA kinase
MIIGIAGETGSGKNTFCQKIKEEIILVETVSSSIVLREALRNFILDNDITKEDLQWMALVLFERFGKDVLSKAIKKRLLESKAKIVLFDGVRMWADYEMLREIGAKVVYVTADSKIRWERVQSRGEKKDDKSTYEEFLKREKAGTETSIPEIGEKADFRIDNNGSLEEFYAKMEKFLKTINN